MSTDPVLTLDAARFLVSEDGLAQARRLEDEEGSELNILRRLRRDVPAAFAAALMSQARGRAALASRHPLASRLHVDAALAAQASSARVATWRARRFGDAESVSDLCAGAGIDAMALAEKAPVVAVEADRARAVLLRANLHAAPDARVVCGRAPEVRPLTSHAFCDPDRRPTGRRETSPEAASPPLRALLDGAPWRGVGIKLSPLAPLQELGGLGEIELVSVGRELKEVVLWWGDLARTERRVSRPELGYSWDAPGGSAPPRTAEPSGFLFDPDPALVRSGRLDRFAVEHDLALLDPTVAYLTGEEAWSHPLVRAWRILAVLPPSPRDVAKHLRENGIGKVTARRRGFAVPPDEFVRRLRLQGGDRRAHLHLTRRGTDRLVIVTDPDFIDWSGTSGQSGG